MKNFWKGFMSIFNIWGNIPKEEIDKIKNKTVEEAMQEDEDAIRSDWEKIGIDMGKAFEKFKKDATE